MLLQCDPTTIYALKRLGLWRGSLARSELAVDEPYNTYVNPGLPPGPICNPGLASLRAAIAPADVPFLYFVAAGDGSHLSPRTTKSSSATRRATTRRAGRRERRGALTARPLLLDSIARFRKAHERIRTEPSAVRAVRPDPRPRHGCAR